MAGNTATISIERFRAEWLEHRTISDLCQRWTITKDQVIRLRDVWELPLRHDRRLRAKPKRQRDPTAAEIAEACRLLQLGWDAKTREARCVHKTQHVHLRVIPIAGLPELPPEDDG